MVMTGERPPVMAVASRQKIRLHNPKHGPHNPLMQPGPSIFKRFLFHALTAGLLATSVVLRAALPMSVYQDMQNKAPEALQIEIISVKSTVNESERQTETRFEATAKVIGVTRSKTGLKKGDTITIKYSRKVWKTGFAEPGPQPNPGRCRRASAGLDRRPPLRP